MTNVKKVVAVMLAFLMIFSSASVLASAWDATVDDGLALNIETKFFKEVGGEWVETTKVKPGIDKVVKARVYLGTDYFSNDSSLLFFYDKDFFSHAYSNSELVVYDVNTENTVLNATAGGFAATNNVTATVVADPDLSDLVAEGYIDNSFTNDYGAISTIVKVKATGEKNVQYDNSTWLLEYTLTVLDTASGEGDFFVKDTTVQSTDRINAAVNVPKGPADSTDVDIWAMWLWDANVTLASNPVSTLSSVTYNANGGTFADGTDTASTEGTIADPIEDAAPVATKDGYAFMGWIDAADTTPTYEEIVEAPTVYPDDDLVLNAYWMETVDITFDTGDGSKIESLTGVKPYDTFANVGNPTLDGYTFKGWDVKGGTLPETYPDKDTTYTAIWAKQVTVSFNMNGADEIPSIDGDAGDDFTAHKVQIEATTPELEGNYFIGWEPALPTVFPDDDTTYTANFETYSYKVNYYVDGKFVISTQIEYGMPIPTVLPFISVDEGKELDGWYTDSAFGTKLVTGATMPALPTDAEGNPSVYNLYAQTTNKRFDAIFMVDNVEYARVETEYEADIIAPGDDDSDILEPAKEGYNFIGWNPYPGTLDQPNNMTFEALWEEAEQQIQYVVDNGVWQKFELNTGAEMEIPADPDKEGYTFLYWSEENPQDVENPAEAEFPATMPVGNLTYYAVFEVNEYTITFDSQEGTAVDKIKQAYGTDVTKPADPTRTGYTFKGWATTAGVTDPAQAATLPTTMPAENQTYYAIWVINQYTITFDTVGGSTISAIKQDYNTAITAPGNPTKAGYTFTGWDKPIPSTMPAEDMTITAQWSINEYTISFDSQEGTAVPSITQDYNTDVTKPADPTRTGYTFKGWATEAGVTDPAKAVELPTKMPAEDQKYYAIWVINQYTITFNTDGGSTIAAITQDYNTDVIAPANPTKTGYTFKSWDNVIPTKMPAEDITITASWTINQYTITFDTDGGTEVKPITQDYDTAVTKPANPSKTGHTFAGWSPEVPTSMPAENITVTAQWTANTYNAVFNANEGAWADGETTKTIPTVFDKAIDTSTVGLTKDDAAAPTRTGYTFMGWSPAVVDKMPAQDLEYTAVWEANTYDAVFNANGGKWADGSTSKTVPTAFDAKIDTTTVGLTKDDANAPTMVGFVFNGWEPTVDVMDDVNGLTFTAKWVNATDTQYTVETYTKNTEGDYVKTSSDIRTGETGELINVKPASYDKGFKEGTDENADNVYEGNILADGSLVLKIYIDRETYTLTTDVDGVTESNDYLYEQTVSVTQPSKTGYDFAGWVDADGNATTVPATMPYNDVTIKATWDARTDTVFKVVMHYTDDKSGDVTVEDKYELTGTTDSTVAIVDEIPAEAAENTTYVLVSDIEAYFASAFSISHYDLDEASSEMNSVKIIADGTAEVDVYYVPVKYTITFDSDVGTYEGGVETITVDLAYNALVSSGKPADPSKTGWTFKGYRNLADDTRVTGVRTYYAVFEANEYTLTFIVEDDDDVRTVTDLCDNVIQAPTVNNKDGYKFLGWSDVEGGKTPVTIPPTMPAGDATYYAIWQIQQYTVTFYNEKGDAESIFTTNADYATEYAVPTPSKTGYSFVSWMNAADDSVVTFTDGKGKIPAVDTSYYADWKINQYTISFVTGDGASTVAPITQNYDTAVTAPAAPTKTGYDFKGWATEADVTDPAKAVELPTTMPAENQTYYAIWTPTVYTIVFDSQEGSDVADITAPYLSAIDAPAAPIKEGYTFGGWATTAGVTDAAQAVTLPTQMPLNGGKYYAIWTPNTYTITFDENGGSDVADITAAYKAPISAPANPTKVGHTFGGWATTAAPTVKVDLPTEMPLNGASYIAIWNVETYNIVWNNEGQTVAGENFPATAIYNSTISSPAMTNTGYTFLGWEYAGTVYAAGKEMTIADAGNDGATITMNAKWSPNTYDAIFNANGGAWADGDTTKTVPTVFNTAIDTKDVGLTKEDAAAPTRAGYKFNGWSPAVGSMTTEGQTFTAQWIANTDTIYTVITYTMDTDRNYVADNNGKGVEYSGTTDELAQHTPVIGEGFVLNTELTKAYNAETGKVEGIVLADNSLVLEVYIDRQSYKFNTSVTGGTTSTEVDYLFGSTVVVPEEESKTGYTFDGWYYEGTKYAAGASFTMPAKNVTLTGTLTINQYTITFDSNGGSAVAAITQDYGTTVTEPAAPTKTGYTFANWSPAVPETMPAENITLVAQWTPNQYTITFDTDGGTKIEPITQAYLSDVTAPANPTKTGYTFAGWYVGDTKVDVPAKMPLDGMTLKAHWDINKYKVTFYNDNPTTPAVVETATVLQSTENNYNLAINPPVATMEGYSFTGWVDAATGAVVDFEAAEVLTPANDVTYYATWSINSHAVNFRANGGKYEDGTDLKTITVTYGEAIVVPEVPTRDGYAFKSWTPVIPATMPDSIQNFQATWDQETYNLKWISDNAEVSGFEATATHGTEITSPEMSKTGYTFNGWTYNGTTYAAGETIKIVDTDLKNGDEIVITASWTANTYDAIFNANGGAWADGTNSKTVPTVFDTAIDTTTVGLTKEDAAAPTRAGYMFNGWSPAVGSMTTTGQTFTAQWIANTDTVYTVITYTMNADGDYVADNNGLGVQYSGTTDQLAQHTPVIGEGFVLNTTKTVDYNPETGKVEGTVLADNSLKLEVYIDRQSYDVVVKVDGTATSTTPKLFGSEVAIPELLTKDGYTFSGWSIGGIAQTPGANVEVPVGGLVIEGSYKVNQYDALFYVDSTLVATVPTNFGETPVAPDAATAEAAKPGYTFVKWTPDLAAMTTAGATYTAEMSAKTGVAYKVEIYTMGLDGKYGTPEVLDKTGATDEPVSYAPEAKTGFTVDEEDVLTPEKSVLSGTVAADGSLTLKVYYSRNQHTITYNVDDKQHKVETYYFGEAITILENLTKEGYTFSGWKNTDGTMAFLPATMPDNDIVINGAFTVNSYNLIYVVDGSTYKTVPYEFGATITAEAAPTKEGYTFSGWSEIPATMPAKDTTITGSFSINTYDLIYVVDGTTYKTVPYEFGATITAEAAPTKEGYTFSGWSTIPATMPAEDTTVTGSFKVNQYDALFYVDDKLVATVPTNFGETPVAPNAATAEAAKPGYTFVKWTPDLAAMTTAGATYTAEMTANSGIVYKVNTYKQNVDTDGNKTYTMTTETFDGTAGDVAKYIVKAFDGFTFEKGTNYDETANTVSGTINGDGSTVLDIYYTRNKITVDVNGEQKDYYFDEQIQEPTKPIPDEGYEQDGWKDEDGNKVDFPYNVPDEEDDKITITPVFVPKEYTATFVAEGTTVETKTVAYLSVIGVPAAPAKEGYYFVGWEDESGVMLTDETTMPAKNVTFTAVYEIKASGVTYVIGGRIVASAALVYGEVIPTTIVGYTTTPGYTFDGWYTDVDCTIKFVEGTTLGVDRITLYGKEIANTYDAIFDANGGAWADNDTSKTVPTVFDESIEVPADPTREGYVFAGWDPYPGLMETVGGMTFTAQWAPDTEAGYTITYKVEGNTYQAFPVAVDDEFEVPADPDVTGKTFLYWSEEDPAVVENPAQAVFPEKMPAGSLTYYAVLSTNIYTATFYNYDAFLNDEGIAVSPFISADYNTETVYSTANYVYGDDIVFPADPTNIDSAYWTFLGWSTEPVKWGPNIDRSVIVETATMDAENAEFYAVYEKVLVKLLPAEGSTTVIERTVADADGNETPYTESFAEDTVTDVPYKTYGEFEGYYFIYGLKEGLSQSKLESDWIAVQGDGRLVINNENSSRMGTGTLVQLYDKNFTEDESDDILVEEFRIVIFGDLDGNSRITTNDSAIVNEEALDRDWSATKTRIEYLFRAANLDGNKRITTNDTAIVNAAALGTIDIDQVTGFEEETA